MTLRWELSRNMLWILWYVIERFLIEWRKPSQSNDNGQSELTLKTNKLWKARENAGTKSQLVSVLHLIGQENGESVLDQSQPEVKQRPMQSRITFDAQLKIARWDNSLCRVNRTEVLLHYEREIWINFCNIPQRTARTWQKFYMHVRRTMCAIVTQGLTDTNRKPKFDDWCLTTIDPGTQNIIFTEIDF